MGMIPFSRRIQEYMREYGLSQSEVADRVGRSKATIGTWARGDNTPIFGDIPEIAEKLGVSIAWLMGFPTAKMINHDEPDIEKLAVEKIEDQKTMDESPKMEINGSLYPVYTVEQLDKRMEMLARAMDMFEQGKITEKMLELIVNSLR